MSGWNKAETTRIDMKGKLFDELQIAERYPNVLRELAA